jgi:hypothetical protein
MNDYYLITIEDGHTWITGGMDLKEIKKYIKNENIHYSDWAVIKGEVLKDFKMVKIEKEGSQGRRRIKNVGNKM